MSGIGVFGDLARALSPYVGGAVLAGYILGMIVVGLLWFAFMIAMGRDADSTNSMIFAASIGVVFSTLIGWFDLWVLVTLIIVVVFMVLLFRRQAAGAGT